MKILFRHLTTEQVLILEGLAKHLGQTCYRDKHGNLEIKFDNPDGMKEKLNELFCDDAKDFKAKD